MSASSQGAGAEAAASSGTPAIHAFWVSSKLARPETGGRRPCRAA
ncbi:hypothetical protein [Micromonospora carbonacea]